MLGKTIAIGDASQGLCGGMAFAARDYFEAGVPIPSMTAPPTSGPVFDHIVMRLYESFNLLLPPPPPPAPPIVPIITPIPPFGPGPLTYWWLMDPALPDHETVASNINLAPRGRAWVAIVDSWPQIRADIEGNRLSPIALIEVKSHDPLQMGKNHQVLAYGYELDGSDLAIRVYDPNFPDDDDVTLSLDISRSAAHHADHALRRHDRVLLLPSGLHTPAAAAFRARRHLRPRRRRTAPHG